MLALASEAHDEWQIQVAVSESFSRVRGTIALCELLLETSDVQVFEQSIRREPAGDYSLRVENGIAELDASAYRDLTHLIQTGEITKAHDPLRKLILALQPIERQIQTTLPYHRLYPRMDRPVPRQSEVTRPEGDLHRFSLDRPRTVALLCQIADASDLEERLFPGDVALLKQHAGQGTYSREEGHFLLERYFGDHLGENQQVKPVIQAVLDEFPLQVRGDVRKSPVCVVADSPPWRRKANGILP